jgi:hypothetical protein
VPDTLLWSQTVSSTGANNAKTTTHTLLIGYESATLVGVNHGANDQRDDSVVGQRVNVNMGGDACDETVIYADTLYLQSGALYEFPGKHVTIVARRLGMASAAPAPATISARGIDAQAPTPPTAPARPAMPKATRGGDHQNGHAGVPGQNGDPGIPGLAGNAAGNVTIRVFETLPNLRLVIDAQGGAGSAGNPGQFGQDGQWGGDGGPEPKSAAAIIL